MNRFFLRPLRLPTLGLPPAPALSFARPVAAAALALLGLTALPAQAGRPLATDDAAIVAPGHCQIELWREWRRGEHASWINPGCNPFGSTEFALGFGRSRAAGEGGALLRSWQVKQLLRETGDDRPGFALVLRGEHDSRVHRGGLLNGNLGLNGILSWPLAGDAVLLHTNLGLRREREDGDDGAGRRTRAAWGLALDLAGPAATRPFVELYGSGSERPLWQAGLRWQAADGLQLDLAFGAQTGRWSHTRQLNLGLVWVFPVTR